MFLVPRRRRQLASKLLHVPSRPTPTTVSSPSSVPVKVAWPAMKASSGSLILPLTFPIPSVIRSGKEKLSEDTTRTLLEASCSKAQPTALTSWGSLNDLLGSEDADKGHVGIVMGCEDGSLFIFKPSPSDPPRPKPSKRESSLGPRKAPSGAHSPYATKSASRSASPSSPHGAPPFTITPRPRSVSGITKEQAEAPKNYVDFDDEPEKLKDILKNRGIRDKTVADGLLPSFDRGLTIEKTSSPSTPPSSSSPTTSQHSRRKDDAKSLLSAMNSPTLSPHLLSVPSSPGLLPTFSLEGFHNEYLFMLQFHIILPYAESIGRSISRIHVTSDNLFAIVLQEVGTVSVFRLKDGACTANVRLPVHARRTNVSTAAEPRDLTRELWVWKQLHIYEDGESTIILVSATVDPEQVLPSIDFQNGEEYDKSRVALYEFHSSDKHGLRECHLEELDEWLLDGHAASVGLHRESSGSFTFFCIDAHGHFLTQQLQILPRIQLPESPHQSNNKPIIPLSNPFKIRNTEVTPEAQEQGSNRIHRDADVKHGSVIEGGNIIGASALSARKLRGLVWTTEQLSIFEYHDKSLRLLVSSSMPGIRNIWWNNDSSYTVVYTERAETFELQVVDADNQPQVESDLAGPLNLLVRPVHSFPIRGGQASHCTAASEVVSTLIDQGNRRKLLVFSPNSERDLSRPKSRTLWKASHEDEQDYSRKSRLTSLLPVELDLVILGYSDGSIRQSSLAAMAAKSFHDTSQKISDLHLNGSIETLRLIQNERTREKFVLGGADDGTIAFWALDSLKMCARWTVFLTPLAVVVQFLEQTVGPLRGCALCVSLDGTIAVVVIDGFQFLCLIPGAASPLQRVCLSENNLLLIYRDGCARLWDIQTREFWRSMGLDKAEELLSQGGWTVSILDDQDHTRDGVFSSISGFDHGIDSASTLLLDIPSFVEDVVNTAKSPSGSVHEKNSANDVLHRCRVILSLLLIPNLNEEIDSLCHTQLGLEPSNVSIGCITQSSVALYTNDDPRDLWCISPEVSAAHALSIIVALRALSLFEEMTDNANTVIAFYATALAQTVGPRFQHPSLVFLARQWLQSSNDLRHAARILFDTGITRLSDEESIQLAEQWQHFLPCLQPNSEKQSMIAAMTLFLCGYMATEKYSLLSSSALTDISKSMTIYLNDEESLHRVLAIDLCSRGFHIWQHYVDAMEVLRALFTLATNTKKEAISSQNVGPQARLAVLHIASTNTPLFMTTLGLDILNPRNLEHRKSVMQLVAFLIRKRPLVVYPNIPRLMEAVVKSLDPNSTASREAVLDTATEILGHVVKTFPTVDFHMATQRLAVGTSEGAVVMYDLKTGTRLYVLEGHTKRLAACSFSPDGRRLVTVSLEEGAVLVWKVGSGFSSFFNPGAPPRQGHGGSAPFKTLSFNVGAEADMTIAGTLEWVRFEWPAERSVKLSIRESVLTFST